MERVETDLQRGLLWPEPLIQLNPAFAGGGGIDDLVRDGVPPRGVLTDLPGVGSRKATTARLLQPHAHQSAAIEEAAAGRDLVLTTGTGSGKSLTYIVPIVDAVLRDPRPGRISAIVVYPMNALANSQLQELEKFLRVGYPDGAEPVRFARYTGQESPPSARQSSRTRRPCC